MSLGLRRAACPVGKAGRLVSDNQKQSGIILNYLKLSGIISNMAMDNCRHVRLCRIKLIFWTILFCYILRSPLTIASASPKPSVRRVRQPRELKKAPSIKCRGRLAGCVHHAWRRPVHTGIGEAFWNFLIGRKFQCAVDVFA
jgi:hypothetical protein